MSFEKDWDSFLEAFLLKIESMLISLFQYESFFDTEMSAVADEMIDGSLQEHGNFEEATCFNLDLQYIKEGDVQKEGFPHVNNEFF